VSRPLFAAARTASKRKKKKSEKKRKKEGQEHKPEKAAERKKKGRTRVILVPHLSMSHAAAQEGEEKCAEGKKKRGKNKTQTISNSYLCPLSSSLPRCNAREKEAQ